MISLRRIVPLIFLAAIAFKGHAQEIGYDDLNDIQKAQLARYLGWVWGDGKPGINNDGDGIYYRVFNPSYEHIIKGLVDIEFNGEKNPLSFPDSDDNIKLKRYWNYWHNSLPGGNLDDPQILQEAIKNPNFLAGIIEGEGQQGHQEQFRYFMIADQFYAPEHPDLTKAYDVRKFGPERMIQLYLLLKDVYGLDSVFMTIKGKRPTGNELHGCEVIEALRIKYDFYKMKNEEAAQDEDLTPEGGFPVKLYVRSSDYEAIRSYGYYPRGNYRTPAPDSDLRRLEVEEVAEHDVLGYKRFQHASGNYLNTDLNMVPLNNNHNFNWKLIDLKNGYYRIEPQNSSMDRKWLQAANNTVVRLAGESWTGFFTQWEKMPVPDTANRYYLKNRRPDSYLRVGNSQSILKHGGRGPAAQWIIEEPPSTDCSQ